MVIDRAVVKQLSVAGAAVVLAVFGGCSATEKTTDRAKERSVEDTVEVGYGTQTRKDVTGSVGSLSAEEIDDAVHHTNVAHVEELLEGRVAGVQVYRTGAGFSVRIRGTSSFHGSNEPLYVVDGMPISPRPGQGLIGVNPADIESIDVIKDGTSAVYGSRGANGVIIIKTKGGR